MKKSIVWLRMMATLLIMNSHFTQLYPPQLKEFSFGGMFGDCLFFLISGYCLARQNRTFPDFAWRRIKRVYIPYLLFIPFLIVAGTTNSWSIGYTLFPYHTYGFITMILCLYPVFYLIMWLDNHTTVKFWKTSLFIIALQIVYFSFAYKNIPDILENKPIESTTFLLSMLLGGCLRNNTKDYKRWLSLAGIIICFALYTIQSLVGFPKEISLVQWWIGVGFVYFLASFVISFEEKLRVYPIVQRLADITLEVYFVNYYIIDAYTGMPFPNNLILCVLSIIGVASAFHWLFDKIIGIMDKGIEIMKLNLSR